MHSPGFTMGEFVAQPAQLEDIGELQAFAESNPEYWLLTHGHPPPSDERPKTSNGVHRRTGYSEHFVCSASRFDSRDPRGLGATDLLAAGVYHLGCFMTATRIHGTG
jgi:hypothetical protein